MQPNETNNQSDQDQLPQPTSNQPTPTQHTALSSVHQLNSPPQQQHTNSQAQGQPIDTQTVSSNLAQYGEMNAFQQPQSFNQQYKKTNALKKALLVLGIGLLLMAMVGFIYMRLSSSGLLSSVPLDEYSNDEINISIMKPTEWEVRESFDYESFKIVTFTEPASNDLNEHSAILTVDVTTTPDEYKDLGGEDKNEYFENVKKGVEDSAGNEHDYYQEGDEYYEVKRIETIKVGDYDALLFEYKIHDYIQESGESGLGKAVTIFIDEFTQATIELRAHDSDKIFADTFSQMLASFEYGE